MIIFTDKHFIEKAMNLVKNNTGLVAVISDCEVQDETIKTSRIYYSSYPHGTVVSGRTFLLDVVAQKVQTTHLSTVYNRSKAIEIGFYNHDILSSDFESIYRLCLYGNLGYLKGIARSMA